MNPADTATRNLFELIRRTRRLRRAHARPGGKPPAANLRARERMFDCFRIHYNDERPHGALGQRTPASFYRYSSRPYPEKIPAIEYPAHFEVRRVSRNGGIRWKYSSATASNNGWINIRVAGGDHNR